MPGAGPAGSASETTRQSGPWVLGVVLATLAVASSAVVLAGAWGLTAEYGSDAIPWAGILPWCVVPALLATGAFLTLRRAAGRGSWPFWVLAPVAWIVLTAVTGTAVALAARQYDATAARAAAACSDLDRALYEGLTIYRPELATPQGEDDGSCSLLLPVQGDAATALATLDASMAADGWMPSGTEAGPRLYTRSADLMTAVPETSDKGYTDVRLSIAPD
jgi:hypothetical protein